MLSRRSIALPADHGTWVFLLSPLTIGLAIGGRWTTPVVYLIIAALCGFLLRQPATIATKALSGRRSRADLRPALAWSLIYTTIGSVHVLGLVLRGMGYLLYLAVPGVAVFGWYLYLVWHRDERRQRTLEVVGAGVLALTAPAGLWAGLDHLEPVGWLLWLLTWAQATASILFVYLRLGQRALSTVPGIGERLRMGLPATSIASLNLLAVGAFGIDQLVSGTLVLAYVPQWVEAILGTWRPARRAKPTHIGFRQLGVSTLYTIVFIWCW